MADERHASQEAPPPGPAREAGDDVLRAPDLFHPTGVYRRGAVVIKETGPWAATVGSLLRHLEAVGFAGAPRVVEGRGDPPGRHTIRYRYIEGQITGRGPWSLEAVAAIGRMLRELHQATAPFRPPPDAQWKPWFGRDLGGRRRVIGHGDAGPWNIVTRAGLPVALIDWEVAGPVDPLVDLAQACWLNAKLHDDLVAAREGLPPLAERARQLRTMVDAYGLTARQRRGFVQRMIEFAVHFTAYQADDGGVTPESTDPRLIWALAWPARAAAWMLRHRRTLQNALS
ncbi:MAG TPA: phosphotransferase [Chloroflexota bacterium]|nr:phosphotransferase [Chloroflexota bacterium]